MAGRFSVQAIFEAVDRMSGPLNRMNVGVAAFAKSAKKELGELEQINNKLVGGMNRIGAMAVAGGVAAAAGIAAAAKPGMEFEQQMANLGAAYLKTRGEIGDLEKEAMRLGAATQFSATEVAGAMENMAKAGFEPQEALDGIAGMTYAAAAAGEDLATTAANVSAVMKGMGIDLKKSGSVADILALASVKTASSIGSLSESMSKVSSTARQLGVPLKDTVAMVALLQDVGLDASEAGSATATMLTMMSKPTDAVAAKMKKMGVSFKDAAGNMKSPAEVLQQLVKAGKKAGGNMSQVAFFADLVGLRGQKAAVNLKELFAAGKYDALVKALDESAGTAKKMSDLRMNTLTGDIDVFTENVKGLSVQLFSLNSGPLRDVVQSMTKWLDKNKDVIVAELQSGIKWLVDHLPQIVWWLKRIATMYVVFNAFAAAVKVAQTAVAAYELTMKLATAANWLFGRSGKVWPVMTGTIRTSTVAMGIFNAQAAAGATGLAGLQAGLNASKLGTAINGVSSKLGAAGLLGAAAGVGVAFGLWLNDTFKLDEKISGMVAKLTGLDDTLNKQGGRAEKPGLQPGGDQYLADGSIRRADGTWVRKSPVRQAKENAAKAAEQNKLSGMGRSPLLSEESPTQALYDEPGPVVSPQLVTPQDRTAKSIEERTTTEKTEIVIKDDTGRAELTKKPKTKNSTIKLQQSGVF